MFLETSGLALRGLRPVPDHPIARTINGVEFEFDFALDPEVKNMYYGFYEYPTMKALRALLRRGDTFLDVGANIGYISAIGMGLVGEEGSVYSFEPVPVYFERLLRLAKANPAYSFTPERIALGDTYGTAIIRVARDNIGWNTLLPDVMPPPLVKEEVEVPVRRLDEYMETAMISTPSLIKIDTEGFEFPVLKGLSRFFEATAERPPIISEITPGSLGMSVLEVWRYMSSWGYRATSLIDQSRLAAEHVTGNTNVLFVAD
jgi:FkbM family methyltransferase